MTTEERLDALIEALIEVETVYPSGMGHRARLESLRRPPAEAERCEEEQSKRGACERVIAEQQRILCKIEPENADLRTRLAEHEATIASFEQMAKLHRRKIEDREAKLRAVEAREDEAAWLVARFLAPWADASHCERLDEIERDSNAWLAARGAR